MCHQYDSPKTQVPALGATLICLCITRHLNDQPSIFPTSCHSLRCFSQMFWQCAFFLSFKYNKPHRSSTMNVQQQQVVWGKAFLKNMQSLKDSPFSLYESAVLCVTKIAAGHNLLSQAHMFSSSNILLMPSQSFCK